MLTLVILFSTFISGAQETGTPIQIERAPILVEQFVGAYSNREKPSILRIAFTYEPECFRVRVNWKPFSPTGFCLKDYHVERYGMTTKNIARTLPGSEGFEITREDIFVAEQEARNSLEPVRLKRISKISFLSDGRMHFQIFDRWVSKNSDQTKLVSEYLNSTKMMTGGFF